MVYRPQPQSHPVFQPFGAQRPPQPEVNKPQQTPLPPRPLGFAGQPTQQPQQMDPRLAQLPGMQGPLTNPATINQRNFLPGNFQAFGGQSGPVRPWGAGGPVNMAPAMAAGQFQSPDSFRGGTYTTSAGQRVTPMAEGGTYTTSAGQRVTPMAEGGTYNAYEQALSGGPAFGSVGQRAQAARGLQQQNQHALGGMSGSAYANDARTAAQQILSHPQGGYRVTRGPAYQDPNAVTPEMRARGMVGSVTPGGNMITERNGRFVMQPISGRAPLPERPVVAPKPRSSIAPQQTNPAAVRRNQAMQNARSERSQFGAGMRAGSFFPNPNWMMGNAFNAAMIGAGAPGVIQAPITKIDRYKRGNPQAGPYGLDGFGGLAEQGRGWYGDQRAASSAANYAAQQQRQAILAANPNAGALPGFDRFGRPLGQQADTGHSGHSGGTSAAGTTGQQLIDDLKAKEDEANAANKARDVEGRGPHNNRIDSVMRAYRDLLGGLERSGGEIGSAYDQRAARILGDLQRRGQGVTQGFADREAQIMGDVERFGDSARRDVSDAFQQSGARIQQDAINRGLSNTTVRQNMLGGNDLRRQRAMLDLEDKLSDRRAQYGMQLSGDRLQALERDLARLGDADVSLSGDRLNYARDLQRLSAGAKQDSIGATSQNLLDRIRFIENQEDVAPSLPLYLALLQQYGAAGGQR